MATVGKREAGVGNRILSLNNTEEELDIGGRAREAGFLRGADKEPLAGRTGEEALFMSDMCTYVCTCMWRRKTSTGGLPQIGYFTSLELSRKARLIGR